MTRVEDIMKKKIAIVLAIITIISKFFGFFREIILSYFYGVSNESDAYIIALAEYGYSCGREF